MTKEKIKDTKKVERIRKTTRHYIFTQKQLKAKLNIEGDIESLGLWVGLSPKEEEDGVSTDTTEWELITSEEKMV